MKDYVSKAIGLAESGDRCFTEDWFKAINDVSSGLEKIRVSAILNSFSFASGGDDDAELVPSLPVNAARLAVVLRSMHGTG